MCQPDGHHQHLLRRRAQHARAPQPHEGAFAGEVGKTARWLRHGAPYPTRRVNPASSSVRPNAGSAAPHCGAHCAAAW